MPNKFRGVLSKLGLGKISSNEYNANLSGMNTFFGATLGFVLTGTEQLNSWKFGVVLMLLASIVISILYITSSRHRAAYAIYTLLAVIALPEMVDFIFKGHDLLPAKIRPTLVVWTLMTIMVEFWSRENDSRGRGHGQLP